MALGAAAFAVVAAACAGEPEFVDEGTGGFDFLSTGAGGDMACAKFENTAISRPVNLYVMFDKSSSMAGNKWDQSVAGLSAFVDDPGSAGLRVALRFFPRPPDGVPACDQSAYSEPSVPFDVLPDNAAAIKSALAAEAPDGFSTPMYPALGGAILEGIEVAQQRPGEVSAVLLVTDGAPTGPAETCSGVDPEDPAEVAALAATGLGFNPPVATYVVGLPGVDQTSADLIAAGGGTTSAILVGSTNVAQEFANALAKVRGDAIPCAYEIPEEVNDGTVTVGQVNIEVTPPDGGEATGLDRNDACDGEGWRYDDPSAPTSIELCPASCDQLKAAEGTTVKVLLGCATSVK